MPPSRDRSSVNQLVTTMRRGIVTPGQRTTVADAVDRLRRFTKSEAHIFWPDDVSLFDTRGIEASHLSGHQQITDVYLLALAVQRSAALATFDRKVSTNAVLGAGEQHLR